MKGGLRLQGPGTFANMVITPDAVDGLSPEPTRDPLDGDRGLVRNWRLSTFSALPNGKDAMYNEMPGASQEWKTISTERNGLVNLSREYGRPLPEPNRAVAWLKATITSDRKQTKKVDIGWTREVWVFVNGKLVYADKNLFEEEGARKFPDARCSLENGAFTLPLEAGDNEVAVAIANNFFGWGLKLRICFGALLFRSATGGECDPARDFKASFGRNGDRLGPPGRESARHSCARRRRGTSGGLDA